MKLISLNVENFGVYSGEHFEFSSRDAHGGFCLVHGRNETGKTTLLQLVRESLFGFRSRNPYDFGNYSGDVAAKVRCELRDGRQFRFRRRKGTKDRVAGEFEGTREPIDEESLDALLGANSELYEHVFAFSIEELAAGEKSLRDAGLTEALFGGGIGGLARFRELRDRVRGEHEELFKSRGRKPRINALLQSITSARTSVTESAVDPKEYARLREELEASGAEGDRVRGVLSELRTSEMRLDRSTRALPTWIRRSVLLEEVAAIETAGPTVAAGVAREFGELETELARVESDLARIESEFDPQQDDGAEPASAVATIPPEIEDRIRVLAEEVGRIRAMRADVPKRRHESEAIGDRVRRRVREVNADWTIDDLDRFATSAVDRARVRRLSEQESSLREREGIARSELNTLERKLAGIRSALDQLPENPRAAGLAELLEKSDGYRRDRARLDELTSEIGRIDERAESIRGELCRHVGVDEIDETTLPTPLTSVVAEFAERRRELEETQEQATRRHREVEEELRRIDDTLARLQSGDSPPDGTRIDGLRRERDEAWGTIRARYVEADESVTPVPPDEFESLVRKSDETADDRIRRAEEVARIEQMTAERERAEQRLEEPVRLLENVNPEIGELDANWQRMWAPCGFEPLSPRAMCQWLERFEELRTLGARRSELEHEQSALAETANAFEKTVQRAFKQAAGVDEGLRRAAEEHERTMVQSRERTRLQDDLPKVEAERNAVDENCRELAAERGQWDSARRELMRSLGLPEDWEVALAESILGEVSELLREHDESRRLLARVNEMLEECERFEQEVRSIASAVDESVADEEALHTLERLRRSCEEARTTRSRREAVAQSRRETAARLERLRQERDKHVSRVDDLVEQTGLGSRAEVREAVGRSRRVEEIRGEIASLERELRIVFEGATVDEIASLLDGIDSDEVERRLDEVRGRLADVQAERDRHAERRGALRERLEGFEGDNGASSAANELESLRAELVAAVDRWAPLVLVQQLITRAVERFERDHQPAILAEVSSLFERMTDGRYVGLQRKLDEAGTLIVERSDGELREPSQLSTGAREQLYLAIRLAFALRYSERAEPLPIVMDDVLVNFDEDRARRTLEVLVEVSERVQVLFLTCHRHVVDIVREVVPDLQAIELTPSGPVSGLPSRRVDEGSPETSRRSRRPRASDVSEDAHPTLFPGS